MQLQSPPASAVSTPGVESGLASGMAQGLAATAALDADGIFGRT